MRYETLDPLRRKMLERRLTLVKLHDQAVAEAGKLRAEREPDWEDAASLATTATVLETLGETDRLELARIDEALARIDRGAYGVCIACHGPIDVERLAAVPEADRCGGCA